MNRSLNIFFLQNHFLLIHQKPESYPWNPQHNKAGGNLHHLLFCLLMNRKINRSITSLCSTAQRLQRSTLDSHRSTGNSTACQSFFTFKRWAYCSVCLACNFSPLIKTLPLLHSYHHCQVLPQNKNYLPISPFS